MRTGEFGIDMLSGNVSDFRLDNVQGWSIRPGNIVGEEQEPWGQCLDGSLLSGSGYYINPGRQHNFPFLLQLTPRGLRYELNPSTMEHPWHLTTDVSAAGEALMQGANSIGLDFDVNESRLGRLDVTRQATMTAPCRAFIPAFTALQGKRMKSTQYPDGYTFGNKTRKAVFYDKTRQAKAVKGVEVPPNVVRCELRLFRNRTIGHTGRGLGLGTFEDVKRIDPADLQSRYVKQVESNVFRYRDGQQMTLDFTTEVELLQTLREQHERGAVDRYISMEGIESIITRFGDLTLFGEALQSAGYSERQTRRHLNRIRQTLQTKAFIDRRRQTTSVASTIDLLRNTFTQ